MGSWGLRVHKSDRGLDYLGLVKITILKQHGCRFFDVPVIMEHLKNHIIDEIKYANRGCSEEDMEECIGSNFPIDYSYAVLLVAECLAEYFKKGKYFIHDYEANEQKKISEFIFTADDLHALAAELRKILDPKHSVYKMWESSALFREWRTHINKLCRTLADEIPNVISEGSGGL